MLMEHRYCEHHDFLQLRRENGLEIKAENTIVGKWPLALKLSKGDDGFDEEFEILDDVLAVTTGGMRSQSRKARVKPSTMETGSSISKMGAGTTGSASTRACMSV